MIEYKVRPVVRFVVTHYSEAIDPDGKTHSSSEQRGEFLNFDNAYSVAFALAKEEQIRRGISENDENFIFPNDVVYQDSMRYSIVDGTRNLNDPKFDV